MEKQVEPNLSMRLKGSKKNRRMKISSCEVGGLSERPDRTKHTRSLSDGGGPLRSWGTGSKDSSRKKLECSED